MADFINKKRPEGPFRQVSRRLALILITTALKIVSVSPQI
jgi:hypothetical protein